MLLGIFSVPITCMFMGLSSACEIGLIDSNVHETKTKWDHSFAD